ncbi:MAG: thioredoxin domain-containing protein [Clostridiales bacterium]|nr:thioredoxin domain-containing protein [Clostridiales bacterium]
MANVLNRDFVSIKVDKEERPDIDSVYMKACQILTGHGGWPTTIIMTADQRPFFAGTYFPKKDPKGRISLLDILDSVIKGWKNDRENLLKTANQIVKLLNSDDEELNIGDSLENTRSLLDEAKSFFRENFDEKYGGFGSSPKFPNPQNLFLLMKFYELEKDKSCIEMVERTLTQMYRGGIYDHIGGGFCRYSTDRQWLVPHFEKMLYDNALLSLVYIEAYRLTENELYKNIANEILDYALREMQGEEGGFCSAQDADTDGVEGKYYLFSPVEIIEVLGEEEGREFCKNYDITEEGNFDGGSILNLLSNRNYASMKTDNQTAIKKLYDYRLGGRMKLDRDDKILTSWNGMMIAALSYAHRVLRDRRYLDAAIKTVEFIEQKLTRKDGSLRVRYRDYEASGTGFLDDYAYYIWGLLELFEVTHKVKYLQKALDYNSKMIDDFWDNDKYGFFLTSKDGERLIYRPKETYDAAVPSANSVAAYNLIRLFEKMRSERLKNMAEKQLRFLAKKAELTPAAHSFALFALMHYYTSSINS